MIEWGDGVDPDLRRAIEASGLDSVDGAFTFSQGQDLSKPNLGTRRRTRLTITDAQGRTHEIYLKRYGPGRWWQRLGRFVSPARREYFAIGLVRAAGVPTMRAMAFGENCPLTDGRSFVLVSPVLGESLERGGSSFFTHSDATVVEAATDKLAALVRALHGAGLVHRDLYACHIFACCSADDSPVGFDLHLIDLARVFRPRWRKFRWFVKDLSQLHYSMPAQWVQKYWTRFLTNYLGPQRAGELECWRRAITRKSESIRRRQAKKTAVGGGGAVT
jgi:hypothetical protein